MRVNISDLSLGILAEAVPDFLRLNELNYAIPQRHMHRMSYNTENGHVAVTDFQSLRFGHPRVKDAQYVPELDDYYSSTRRRYPLHDSIHTTRDDVFSFGITLFKTFFNSHPHPEKMAVLGKICIYIVWSGYSISVGGFVPCGFFLGWARPLW